MELDEDMKLDQLNFEAVGEDLEGVNDVEGMLE